jgi:hypothetical protein
VDVLLSARRSGPSAAVRSLVAKDWAYWKEGILTDLERVHPRIQGCVSRLDVMRIGHAMVHDGWRRVFGNVGR